MALVCWSGGCDSTLLLLRLLKESSAEKPVRTVSFSLPDQLVNSDQQKLFRAAQMEKFKKAGFHHKHSELRFDVTGETWIQSTNGVSPQSALWLAFAVPHLTENEDLYVGWVQHDDVWHKIGFVYHTFTNLAGLLEKKGKLLYPLEWTTKAEIIAELKKEGYLDFCTWCEAPNGFHPCGECGSCERHAATLREMEFKEKRGK